MRVCLLCVLYQWILHVHHTHILALSRTHKIANSFSIIIVAKVNKTAIWPYYGPIWAKINYMCRCVQVSEFSSNKRMFACLFEQLLFRSRDTMCIFHFEHIKLHYIWYYINKYFQFVSVLQSNIPKCYFRYFAKEFPMKFNLVYFSSEFKIIFHGFLQYAHGSYELRLFQVRAGKSN